MIVPSDPNLPVAPPASPVQLGLRRFGVVAAALVPIVAAVLIDAYQRGELQVPERWAVPVSLAIAIWLGYTKTQKEHGRAADAAHLADQGMPIGTPLDAAAVKQALFTEFRMPEYVAPPPRPTGPDPGRSTWR
jgi:hypothetical protein